MIIKKEAIDEVVKHLNRQLRDLNNAKMKNKYTIKSLALQQRALKIEIGITHKLINDLKRK